MSYILDALKRADAERQRGTVPSLHARQVTTPTLPQASDGQRRLWLTAGTVLLVGTVVAAGLWFWRAPSATERPAEARIALSSPAPVVSPSPVPALASPAPLPIPVPVTPVPKKTEPAPKPEAPPRRVVVSKPAPLPSTAAVPAAPKSKPETVVAKAAQPSASAPVMPVSKLAPAPEAAPKADTSRVAAADLPLLSELPDDIRRQIPAMAINGVVYSENPGQRVLLVNQQVLTQGSQAVPEVRLEEIRPRSSVFNFRGTRFRLAH